MLSPLLSWLTGSSGSFYCSLWLAYMHMVLLGIDLLCMHNNKAVFGQYKQHQAGFFEILKPSNGTAAAGGSLTIKAADDGSVAAERKPPGMLDNPELYNLSAEDLNIIAAILATLLMVRRRQVLNPRYKYALAQTSVSISTARLAGRFTKCIAVLA
jgi:hypothetical protein